jgi:hypothetical protein
MKPVKIPAQQETEVHPENLALPPGQADVPIEIYPPSTVIRRRGWQMTEEVVPAFIKISTAFKAELASIDGNALKVWVYIALSINRNTEEAHPGIRTIATACNLAQNTVTAAVRSLEALGLLTVLRGDRQYNIYAVPAYVSANSKTASIIEAPEEPSASVDDASASTEAVSASKLLRHNQINQSNQKVHAPTAAPLSQAGFDAANRTVDSVLHADAVAREMQTKGKGWPGRESVPEQLRDLLDVYVQLTGQRPLKGQLSDWLATAQDWHDLEIRTSDLKTAYAQAKPPDGRGFAVTRPGSLTSTAGAIAGERRAKTATPGINIDAVEQTRRAQAARLAETAQAVPPPADFFRAAKKLSEKLNVRKD